ncbi:MAG: hypothetical protein AB7N69_05445 [Immundisolibacter sp.]|uniref:hypothetical protein n=1 Tax=Immundisolibacter sp. TaxID=1934948 RepID=UPI003D1233BA
MRYISVVCGSLFLAVLAGCAQTSAVMVDGNKTYESVTNTQILMKHPDKPYKEIAVLESRGPVGTPLTDLLESMRKKGMAIGADAVIPAQDASEQAPQGLMYNPWLGGYQTLPGGRVPVIRGVAIKYQ